MYLDPIVEEIHQIRERYCQQFEFDLHKIFVDVKQREQQSQHRIVNFSLNKRQMPNNGVKLTQKGGR
jgi:hypothetical protein